MEKGKSKEEGGSLHCTGSSDFLGSLVPAKGVSWQVHLKRNHNLIVNSSKRFVYNYFSNENKNYEDNFIL